MDEDRIKVFLTVFPFVWLTIMLVALMIESRWESCKLIISILGTIDQLLINRLWEEVGE